MSELDPPIDPTVNQTYSLNGRTWKWNGSSWVSYNTSSFVQFSDVSVQSVPDKIVSRDSSGNIFVGKIQHTGFDLTSGLEIGQLASITKTLLLTTDWQDTGISGNNLTNGTYIVQLYANDLSSGGTNNNEYYSGILSWYSGTTLSDNELPTDEIVLHRSGASGEGALYLRTYRVDNSVLTLQIYSNQAISSPSNYVFKFIRVL